MKKKDVNIIMAAVTVLVMFKTMINRVINDDADELMEDENEEETEVLPLQVSDDEYEYFNELIQSIPLENLTEEELENIELEDLLQSFSDSLEFKLALMKNSTVLKDLLSSKVSLDNDDDDEVGNAVSDSWGLLLLFTNWSAFINYPFAPRTNV